MQSAACAHAPAPASSVLQPNASWCLPARPSPSLSRSLPLAGCPGGCCEADPCEDDQARRCMKCMQYMDAGLCCCAACTWLLVALPEPLAPLMLLQQKGLRRPPMAKTRCQTSLLIRQAAGTRPCQAAVPHVRRRPQRQQRGAHPGALLWPPLGKAQQALTASPPAILQPYQVRDLQPVCPAEGFQLTPVEPQRQVDTLTNNRSRFRCHASGDLYMPQFCRTSFSPARRPRTIPPQ